MKIKILFLIILLLSLKVISASIQNESWLEITNPNARMKALGDAGVALNDNSSSLYVNPAVMAYDPHGRLSLFYGNLSEGAHYGYMEYVYPFSVWGSFGVSFEARFKDASNHLQYYSFGTAAKIIESFALGVSAKALVKTLNDDYAQDFGIDAGMHISPFKWFNVGIKAENIKAPQLQYENSKSTESFARNIKAGFSIYHDRYFTLLVDLHAKDVNEKFGKRKMEGEYGIELYPDPALAVRGGVKGDIWRMGLGIISKNMNFDYAVTSEYDAVVHFLQCAYKFGLAPSRKEVELLEKEKNMKKDALYLEALTMLNMQEVATAKQKTNEYIEKYGCDDRITNLEKDIEKWLNKVRKEKLGRAKEFKKEILTDYYQGNLEQALIKLANLKLLAPNYEDADYLDYLLNAGVLLEQGKYKEAEEKLVKALQIDPDSQEVRDLYNRLREVIKLSE